MGIFKNNKTSLPDFWRQYIGSFKEKPTTDVDQLTFVVLDTETTGFDYKQDRILSIGALKLRNNNMAINESLEVYVDQEYYNAETAEIHGILKKGKMKKVSEEEALEILLLYLGNAVIVAHHAQFDINMLNKALNRHQLPKLMNQVLDTSHLYKKTLLKSNLLEKKEHYTLDELAEKFDISKADRHTAMGDAYITSIIFLKVLSKLKDKREIDLKYLLK
ncbi:PolC-type DNA polymerase III [Spongiimicrobium sp. 3-5]|uniref:3'-5' exonuclease n=1 Tax=Spongiimicrobium sp. 3-5 TaxID=3332596 RepID=UPI003980EC32